MSKATSVASDDEDEILAPEPNVPDSTGDNLVSLYPQHLTPQVAMGLRVANFAIVAGVLPVIGTGFLYDYFKRERVSGNLENARAGALSGMATGSVAGLVSGLGDGLLTGDWEFSKFWGPTLAGTVIGAMTGSVTGAIVARVKDSVAKKKLSASVKRRKRKA